MVVLVAVLMVVKEDASVVVRAHVKALVDGGALGLHQDILLSINRYLFFDK